jgi:RNA polymerase sigma factor (sigma-70 family)
VHGSADETGAAGYRPLLFSIAYGMTGSVGDAEDIVQDAFLGLTRASQAGTTIADPKAYLTTAVTRLGINYLGSARVRRETYVGDWLPEPVVVPADGPGPAEHAELADSLSMAFLVLLEALSPVERAVFMLREVFGYGYPDVARITGKTEVNCRQIFARARHRIAAGGQARDSVPPPARQAEGEELARRFFEAAAGGDMDALLGMLAPDVVVHGDGGGKAQAIGKPLAGRQRVMRMLLALFRRGRAIGASIRLAWVNGQPGAVLYDAEGRVVSVLELDVADGVVQAIRGVVNPDKLRHLGPVSDVARLPEKELARGTAAAPPGSGKRSGGPPAGRHRRTDRHPRSLNVKPQSSPWPLGAAARRSLRGRGCGS